MRDNRKAYLVRFAKDVCMQSIVANSDMKFTTKDSKKQKIHRRGAKDAEKGKRINDKNDKTLDENFFYNQSLSFLSLYRSYR